LSEDGRNGFAEVERIDESKGEAAPNSGTDAILKAVDQRFVRHQGHCSANNATRDATIERI
jgi:hypothetical protein